MSICDDCKRGIHNKCNPTRCACQHRIEKEVVKCPYIGLDFPDYKSWLCECFNYPK